MLPFQVGDSEDPDYLDISPYLTYCTTKIFVRKALQLMLRKLRTSKFGDWLRSESYIHYLSKKLFYSFACHTPFVSLTHLHIGGARFFNLRRLRVEEPVPKLVVIGAQRSATTTLHEVLSWHPEIFMSFPTKEPCFFPTRVEKDGAWLEYMNSKGMRFSSWQELLKRYMLFGYGGQEWFGEASTYYTMGDNSRYYRIPQAIKSISPDAKLIYIMRHPLERIRSHFLAVFQYDQLNNIDEFIKKNPVITYEQCLHLVLQCHEGAKLNRSYRIRGCFAKWGFMR